MQPMVIIMTLKPTDKRALKEAPKTVRKGVVDVFYTPWNLLDFEVVLRKPVKENTYAALGFSRHGVRTNLNKMDVKTIMKRRAMNAPHRLHWDDVPKKTRKAITAFLESR